MTAYLDASVVLRVVLGQPDRLDAWDRIDAAVTSALTEVECLRTLDRRHRCGLLPDAVLAERRALVFNLLARTDRIELTPSVLRRASDPFPTTLGTLDALHLASALLWAQSRSTSPVLATHDAELGLAARASGLEVIGV